LGPGHSLTGEVMWD